MLKNEARLYAPVISAGEILHGPMALSGMPILPPHMEALIAPLITSLLSLLALPKFGLSTVFVVSFISATLLPLGSEPLVFGFLKLNPDLYWPTVLVATAGNTLGGAVDWWMGYGAHKAVDTYRGGKTSAFETRALAWLGKLGPKACLLSWLPGIGDPLCAVAGWLKLPFWPCLAYMAVGKLARYTVFSALLLWVFPGKITL